MNCFLSHLKTLCKFAPASMGNGQFIKREIRSGIVFRISLSIFIVLTDSSFFLHLLSLFNLRLMSGIKLNGRIYPDISRNSEMPHFFATSAAMQMGR